MTASKHRTKLRKLDSGVKPLTETSSLTSLDRIVAEKYRAWLIRRGFREEVL